MVQVLTGYGVDSAKLFADAGLDAAHHQSSDARVVAVAMQKVWRAAVIETGDEAFGLRFARTMHPGALQGLGFAWAASNTLRDAFERLVRYYRLISTAGEVILDSHDREVRLVFQIPGPPGAAAPASLDAALGLFVSLCRLTRDEAFGPIAVSTQRPPPANPTPFTEFFGCEIEFGAATNVLTFDAAELDQPLPMANPELARANDQVIIDYLERQQDADVVSRVRAKIIDWLPSGAPSQEAIATEMNMSSRTLQRKLGAEGHTFSGLLDGVRSELAQQYLAVSGRSISEVAYLLGFTEPGNFARSFKRWTGQTPGEYQATN